MKRSAFESMLWLVALALVIVLVMPAQHVTVEAGQVASSDGFTLLTAQSNDPAASGGRELLYVVDHRTGTLLIYGVERDETGQHPVLLDGGPMSVLFHQPAIPGTP